MQTSFRLIEYTREQCGQFHIQLFSIESIAFTESLYTLRYNRGKLLDIAVSRNLFSQSLKYRVALGYMLLSMCLFGSGERSDFAEVQHTNLIHMVPYAEIRFWHTSTKASLGEFGMLCQKQDGSPCRHMARQCLRVGSKRPPSALNVL